MAKQLQMVFMVFCLGIFLFPRQTVMLQSQEMNCCQKEQPSKDCCSKASPEEKKQDQHSCEGNCADCSGCSVPVVFLSANLQPLSFRKGVQISQKVENLYLQPHVSVPCPSIWQPPKIG